tara:strand:- start:1339 stop:1587 length:249 start_codon:yes stop_codon:yes gene_type:complete
MIIVGYESRTTEDPYSEEIVVSRHDTKQEANSAMIELRIAQQGNDNLLQYFYALNKTDTEYKITGVVDKDKPLPPTAPDGED